MCTEFQLVLCPGLKQFRSASHSPDRDRDMAQQADQSTARDHTWAPISASIVSQRTSNPIRKIVDQLNIPINAAKPRIQLSIGDPTTYGNLPKSPVATAAIRTALESGKYDGYPHSCGYPETRAALAQHCSQHDRHGSVQYSAEDVIVASGCSHALELCFGALANEGDNVLIPQPGFSLYQTLLDSKGVEARGYPLLPEHGWQADLSALERLIDGQTRALLLNNPSNPCGSVWPADHLREVLNIAAKHHLPVIADEIYGGMVFESGTFVPAAVLAPHVPVLTVGGIAKQWLVPGWRVGWLLIHDPLGVLGHVRAGLLALTTTILGANSVVQGALPTILRDTPAEFYAHVNGQLRAQAAYLVARLSAVPGLRCIAPQGAMYMMVGLELQQFRDLADDMAFALELLREQSLAVLPGQAFRMPNYVRLVVCAPLPTLTEACNRIEEFCRAHHL